MARYRDEDEDDRDDRPARRPRDDDRDDDDRPRRRSRDDRDDDRPRRSRRDDSRPVGKRFNVLGLLSMILGILSVIVTIFFGCCYGWVFGIAGGVGSLIMGIIGMSAAKKSDGQMGGGMAVAGTVLGGITVVFAILWGLVFAAMFGIAATFPATPSASLTTPADVTITAVQLDTEYDQNVAAADAKYKGKMVEVTGVVERVADDLKKFRLTVELTGSVGSTVDCDFSTSDKGALSSLKPGSNVTIRGKCIGRRPIDGSKWVTLENCVIVPPELKSDTKPGDGKPGLKVTAEQVRKAADDDLMAATKKYGGKVVEMSGQITGIDRTTPDEVVVGLGVGTRGDVQCLFTGKDAATLAGLKNGQKVTVRGTCIIDEGLVSIVTVKDCTLVK